MIDDLLAPGVTRPRIDRALRTVWLTAAHDVARGAVRAVGPVEDPAAGRNYYRAGDLLLNAAAGLVAARRDGTFVDVPGGDVFGRAGFRIATPAALDAPLQAAHVARLDDAERRDVAYHRPRTVGELLFNDFD